MSQLQDRDPMLAGIKAMARKSPRRRTPNRTSGGRDGPKVLLARIEELESRLSEYENAKRRQTSHTPNPGGISSSSEYGALTQVALNSARVQIFLPHSDPTRGSVPALSPSLARPSTSFSAPSTRWSGNEIIRASPGSTIRADSSLSSSHTFGSRVQDLLTRSQADDQHAPSEAAETPTPYQPSKEVLRDAPVRGLRGKLPDLPSQEDAQKLVEMAMFFIGQTQQHLDARDFSDRLWLFFSNPRNTSQLQTPWELEMMIVLAIGALFIPDPDEINYAAGARWFEYVQNNLPTLCELYKYGRLGVEIFALLAVYLQNDYRRDEAYLYISNALRLAISHKYHRASGTQHLMQSEKIHVNRLWWTIYMQERRLAAATGNPSGINDELIDVEFPTDSPGFAPSGPICTNIKIARVTGRILSVLYGPELQTEATFVPNVQEIVKSLYDISQEIPSESTTDVPGTGRDLTLRTTAALHLMLYQATLLTIRPIMLHVAKLILSGEGPSGETLMSSPLGRLSRTCSEAARRVLKLVNVLRKRDMIAIHGFFDFDAVFSGAFIMILTAVLNSVCEDRQKFSPSPGLQDAMDIMQYLADQGNSFAQKRMQEVKRIWTAMSQQVQSLKRLEIDRATQSADAAVRDGTDSRTIFAVGVGTNSRNVPAGDEYGSIRNHSWASITLGDQTSGVMPTNSEAAELTSEDPIERNVLDTDLWDNFSHIWLPPSENRAEDSNHDISISDMPQDEYYKYYYSLYNNLEWSLTGEDIGDFAELGRHLADAGAWPRI
ncbi:Fc.00g058390.m01.CDS01 [Cosmosporella sp. VM-42]